MFLVGVLFPEFRLQTYFLQTGKDKLTENLLTDFLSDGVHVELSTHYHQLVLETALAFVELAQLNGVALDEALLLRLMKALEFSMCMQWPNGAIPLINDSDNGNHLAMLALGSRLFGDGQLLWAATLGRAGTPPQRLSRHFDCSGYVVLCDSWGGDPATYTRRQHVFYDCALLGEGSHSHYDLFNFCYYVNGEPVVIDPGRYTYAADPDEHGIDWRQQFKSTAYHNTVTIDRQDQTRYISKANRSPNGQMATHSTTPVDRLDQDRYVPKVKHGPDVQLLEKAVFLGDRSDWICATAQSAEYTPLHQRLCLYMHRQYLMILDHIQIADGELHECALRFHLAEKYLDAVSLAREGHEIVARLQPLHIRSYAGPGLEACLEQGWVSTTYGVKTAAPVVTLVQRSAQPTFFCSALASAGMRGNSLAVHALTRLAAPADNVLLFRVDGVTGGAVFRDWLLFQRGTIKTVQWEGITFRGRFLTCRQDEQGQFVYLCAPQPAWLEIQDGPQFTRTAGEHVEWSVQAP